MGSFLTQNDKFGAILVTIVDEVITATKNT